MGFFTMEEHLIYRHKSGGLNNSGGSHARPKAAAVRGGFATLPSIRGWY